jgi:hypothetical protein
MHARRPVNFILKEKTTSWRMGIYFISVSTFNISDDPTTFDINSAVLPVYSGGFWTEPAPGSEAS